MLLIAMLGAVLAVDAPTHAPQMTAKGSTVALTFGTGTGIYFSASHDGGQSFSVPVKMAEGAVLPLSRHRGPHISGAVARRP